jgi:hypothetical protein
VKIYGNGDLQSHIDGESFAEFDVFMDKTIQYLASSSSKKSIGCLSRKFYIRDAIEITASILIKIMNLTIRHV